jgi:hypothetical protein
MIRVDSTSEVNTMRLIMVKIERIVPQGIEETKRVSGTAEGNRLTQSEPTINRAHMGD